MCQVYTNLQSLAKCLACLIFTRTVPQTTRNLVFLTCSDIVVELDRAAYQVTGIPRVRGVIDSKPGIKGINQPLTGFRFCLCHSRQSRLKHLQLLEATAEPHKNALKSAIVRTPMQTQPCTQIVPLFRCRLQTDSVCQRWWIITHCDCINSTSKLFLQNQHGVI